MMLTLRTVSVAAGVMNAVLSSTVLALIEAVSVVSGLAVQDGAQGLLVCSGQIGVALKVLTGKGVKDILEGGHERSPCMRELIRW